jgi:lipopolysaccharide transport system ATP-binding protein
MSDTAILIEDLSKKYLLRHRHSRTGDGLRHVLQDAITSPWRHLLGRFKSQEKNESNGSTPRMVSDPGTKDAAIEEFFALQSINLEIKQGDVVGIIGRNGAGKSTLLKVLSRITEPTTGRVGIKGRVASLLEVGTGFHHELTGRENIYLNGAILGMSRTEVRRKFDEIVSFAGVERFVDTPVKRYSSGMYVRLAFAVAAHLDPEILIVDEVLAVGDAEFQKKSLGRMKDVASGGRTVLFVSHNMASISTLCSRAVFLERGHLVADGSVPPVIKKYLEAAESGTARVSWDDFSEAPGNGRIRITDIEIRANQETASEVKTSDVVTISIGFRVLVSLVKVSPYLLLLDEMGVEVLCAVDLPSAIAEPDPIILSTFAPGQYRTECFLPADLLNERRYYVKVGFNTNLTDHEFRTEELISFLAVKSDAMRSEYHGEWPGLIRPRLRWRTARVLTE